MDLTIYSLPCEIINDILYHHLLFKDIYSCLLTAKLFHVLSEVQSSVIKNASNGWSHCIENGLLAESKWLYDLGMRLNLPIDIHIHYAVVSYAIIGYELTHSPSDKKKLWVPDSDKICILNGPYMIPAGIETHLCDEGEWRWSPFINCCFHGYSEIAKWLYDLSLQIKSPIDIHQAEDIAFRECCGRGHLELAQWLYNLSIQNNTSINIHAKNEDAFITACYENRLEVAQWLFKLSIELNSPIDIHKEEDGAFKWSCDHGCLESVKWLYNLSIQINSPINIHVVNGDAFDAACSTNHLEVAKWLYKLSIELNSPIDSVYMDPIFMLYCQDDNTEIIKWLQSMNIKISRVRQQFEPP
jgi:hypothetical protein